MEPVDPRGVGPLAQMLLETPHALRVPGGLDRHRSVGLVDTADAKTKIRKLMTNAPPEAVITLQGIGVSPAMPTAQAFQRSE